MGPVKGRGTHSEPEVHVSCLLDLCLGVEGVVELKQGLDRLGLGRLVVVELILVVRRRLAGCLLAGLERVTMPMRCSCELLASSMSALEQRRRCVWVDADLVLSVEHEVDDLERLLNVRDLLQQPSSSLRQVHLHVPVLAAHTKPSQVGSASTRDHG